MTKAQRKAKIDYDGGLCAGHLLVWTWRKLVQGHEDCPLLVREYDRFAGPNADLLLAAFAAFLMALGQASRRTLSVGRPYCAGVTSDEEQMLRLVAAAQEDDRGLVGAHLSWMVRRECLESVTHAVNRLAVLLTVSGVVLPPVRVEAPTGPALLEVVRVYA